MVNRTNRIFSNPVELRAAAKKVDEQFSKLIKKKKFESYKIQKLVMAIENKSWSVNIDVILSTGYCVRILEDSWT